MAFVIILRLWIMRCDSVFLAISPSLISTTRRLCVWSVVLSGSWYLSSLTAKNIWNLILPLTTTSDFSPRQVYLPVISPKILRVVSSHRILTACPHYILYQMLHMWGRLYDIIRKNKESWLVCTLIGKMFSASSFKLSDLPYDCSHKSRVLVSLKIYDKDFS